MEPPWRAGASSLSPIASARPATALTASASTPTLRSHSPLAQVHPLLTDKQPPRVVGSPTSLRKGAPSPGGNGRPSPFPAFAAPTPTRKARPATAIALSSSATIQSILSATTSARGDEHVQQIESTARRQLLEKRPSNLAAINSTTTTPVPVPTPTAMETCEAMAPFRRTTQRCVGCGGYAELCMACLAQFRQQDVAGYKRELIRSVEFLFERATARAFTKMSDVVVQWVFGVWRRETRLQRRRRILATQSLHRAELRRVFGDWRRFIYERRVLGAMLYAEQQQQVTRDKTQEIAALHGDVFALNATSQVTAEVQAATLHGLREQLAALQKGLEAKNDELLGLRRELHAAQTRVAVLEKQAIDPRELERLRTENVEAKKTAFQLVTALFETLETQLEVVATSEGRQNLNNVFSKEVLQMLDRPEHPGFYNPLADLEAAGGGGPGGGSGSGGGSLLLASFEAPVDRADRILLQWANSLLHRPPYTDWFGSGGPPIPRLTNFTSSLSDGRALVVLTKALHAAMCKFRPKRPPGMAASKLEATSVLRENGEDLTEIGMERYVDHVRREAAPGKRLELMITTLGQALWLPVGLVRAADVLAGDAEANFATLSYLFCTFSPCLDDAHATTCNELKAQLSSARTKWRELREVAFAASTTTTAAAESESLRAPQQSQLSLAMKMKLALTQTLELKRRIDAEDLKSRDGHVLWWKSARIVLRKCFLSYARLARGQAGVLSKLEAQQDENEAFARIPKPRLIDLQLPSEDFTWETKLLQSYLATIYCDLGRIYRGYATRVDPAGQVINVGDLTELLIECRVIDAAGGFTVQDLHAVLRKMDPKLVLGTISNNRVVTPSEYLEGLVRVARRKYPSTEGHRVTLSEAFCLLVENCIIPFAFRADADLFRKQIEDHKVRRLLLKFADELKGLYGRYAVDDHKKKRKRPRLTTSTFAQCLVDRHIPDQALNHERIESIVQRVARTYKKEQEIDGQGRSGSGGGTDEDEDEITYDEFEEAVVVVACYKFPDPYISLESRLEKFLAVYVRGWTSNDTPGA